MPSTEATEAIIINDNDDEKAKAVEEDEGKAFLKHVNALLDTIDFKQGRRAPEQVLQA